MVFNGINKSVRHVQSNPIIDKANELSFDHSIIVKQGQQLFIWKLNRRLHQRRPHATDAEKEGCWLRLVMGKLPKLEVELRAKPLVYRNFRPPSMANYKDKLIVLSGGYITGGKSSEIYSIEIDSWSQAPDLHEFRHSHSTHIHGKFVYIFAGI